MALTTPFHPRAGGGLTLRVDISDEWGDSNPFSWASGALSPAPGLGR